MIQYEQFIRDMQTQNRTAADNQADRNGYEELQQEVRPPVFFGYVNFYRIINKIKKNHIKYILVRLTEMLWDRVRLLLFL